MNARHLLLTFAFSFSVGLSSPTRARAAAIEIDEIEFEGVTLFQGAELETALELRPGDRLEQNRVVRTSENIQKLYRSRGYEQVSIRSRLAKRPAERPDQLLDILTFVVKEGRPTRIGEVRIEVERSQDTDVMEAWKFFQPKVAERFGLKVGEILDQEKLIEGRRSVQDLLTSEEYFGAKVVEIKATLLSQKEEERKVSLTVVVSLGEKVSFGFQGNEFFSASELQGFIAELRNVGFGKNYVETIKQKLAAEYAKYGFARAQVNVLTFERPAGAGRHVRFQIVEGPKVRIDRIDFDGNLAYTNEKLQEIFFQRGSLLVQQGIYVEKDVEVAVDKTLEWVRSTGYLFAKVLNTQVTVLPAKMGAEPGSRVRLVILLAEGDQTVVRAINIAGAGGTGISPDSPPGLKENEVRDLTGNHEGAPLNLYALSEGLESLKAAYRARGYLDFKVLNENSEDLVKYTDENRTADLTLELSQGVQYRVSRVTVEGLIKTKENVVRRELQFHDEEVLEETKVIESETRLRRLGIFALVTIKAYDEPDRPGYKSIRVSVQESVPGVLAGGVGFRNDLGGRVFGQYEYTNLYGRGHALGFNLSLNRRVEDFRFVEYQGQMTYLYPWFLFKEVTLRPSLTVSQRQYYTFDAFNITAAANWERVLWRKPKITGLFTASMERIRQFNAKQFPEQDNQILLIGAVTPGLQFDTRDQPLNPSKGFFAQTSYEYALPQFSHSRFRDGENYVVAYTKLQARADAFVPIFGSGVWYFSWRTGYARNLVPVPKDGNGVPLDNRVGTIPLIKQYTLGGANSLRGYREQELNYQTIAIHGTLAYSNYRTQFDVPFAGALRFGPFLDAGNLLIDDYSFGQLKYGAGVGFHYPTPVGPVNLDWGFKLTQDGGGDPYRFYFSIGVI